MKRVLLSALMLGVFALVTGCADETKSTTSAKVETPGGTVEKKVVETEKKTGDAKNP